MNNIQIELHDIYAAKCILKDVLGVIFDKREQALLRIDKNSSFLALLEFANDLAAEIVRVEMWRDEDENE